VVLAVLVAGTTLWSGCSDSDQGPFSPTPSQQAGRAGPPDIAAAIAAQERHTPALMRIPGVVGTAVGLNPAGQAVVRALLTRPDIAGIPDAVDGIPVTRTVTGMLVAFSNPTTKARPAPLGYSVGHHDITAGTIGARVRNGAGQVFILSNNHVLANSNGATVGDPILQPGPYDGGTAADQVATLFAFRAIDFATNGRNTMDAAIALTTTAEVDFSTPTDDGYGPPGTTIFNDGNRDGLFDNVAALLNTPVQKFGRTTLRTHGTITGINASVSICYEVLIIFCLRSANFVDQLIIEPGGFSDGGDSGSLIVTDDAGRNPVALLFAGSTTQTIANRIDLVLDYFDVTIDGGNGPPPTPVTDAAISSVSAPAEVAAGATVNVTVAVRNVGTEAISTPFDVSLQDATDAVSLGTQAVASLAPGAVTNLSFSWNTTAASLGDHTLAASHTLTDDNGANNQASTISVVSATGPGDGTMHVGDLDGIPSDDGTTWSAIVEVTIHDSNHQPLNGATIVGSWNRRGLNSDTCTTGELGGNGTCIMLFPSLRTSVKSVTFTVGSVTMAGKTYASGSNHDPDGDSNGTSIKVNRP
jgi:hypothetical protein